MEKKNHNMKIFLILIISAVVLIAAAAVTVFFLTRDDNKTPNTEEYLPKEYPDGPSGLDDEYTARY